MNRTRRRPSLAKLTKLVGESKIRTCECEWLGLYGDTETRPGQARPVHRRSQHQCKSKEAGHLTKEFISWTQHNTGTSHFPVVFEGTDFCISASSAFPFVHYLQLTALNGVISTKRFLKACRMLFFFDNIFDCMSVWRVRNP